jgi:hypothetical protein
MATWRGIRAASGVSSEDCDLSAACIWALLAGVDENGCGYS